MSGFTLPVGAIITERLRLTGNTATDVLQAERGRLTVLSIEATERAGTTPNLTIAITDGTTTWFKRNAAAMAANATVTFENVFVLNTGEKVTATSSNASGNIDIEITYGAFDISGRGAPTQG